MRRVREAHLHGKRHLQKRPYIIPLLGLVLGFGIVGAIWVSRSSGQTFRPSEAHVVFLFDSGQRRVLDTKAKTVSELIGRLNLNLIDQDVVEPALDEPIVEDNFRVNIYRARPVTVVDGSNKIVTLTAQRSPRVVAQNAGLKVNAEDVATFNRGDLRENIVGEQVVISRATPVLFNLYGAQLTTYTQAKTVGGLLSEKQIDLLSGESVAPAENTPITPNLQVFVLRSGARVVTEEATVPAPEQVVNDRSLSFGTTVVRQEGAAGKKVQTYIVSVRDGKEERQLVHEVIIQAPVPKIIARGTTIAINADKQAVMAAAGIAASDFAYANYIVSHESGWRPTVSGLPPGGPYAGAYGLCQANPGSKMVSAGSDWLTNPVTQLKWCSGYAKSRYGGWAASYNHWASHRSW